MSFRLRRLDAEGDLTHQDLTASFKAQWSIRHSYAQTEDQAIMSFRIRGYPLKPQFELGQTN
jgi:hypothetical protein